ncbi:hypothetical protein FB45DRAFT_1119792 [Roridomyces roridus]|uniref:Enoyl reductase (ER) domain-containing protein n=1 Tax=Roridomyces roridus TaxID=1738132 RepID=A0AAD7B5C0_9AGAR|nr:hypothetical protein FB45DRAFT_1119792 [Roridomyces roridus]
MTSTPQTMLAARYVPGNEKLVLDPAYPIRELKDDEVLLKMAAAGVCHTDTAFLSGVLLDTRTYVMGHEACGIPVKLGAKVNKHHIHLGKFYSVLNLNGCTHGLNGASALLNQFGIGNDGSYAEYFITTFDLLVPVKPGDKVLIDGVGGLGHLAVQYAKHFGATVYVCDFKPAARELALELGANEAFDWIQLNERLTAGFTVDTTIDFVANNQTFTTAMAAVARNAVNFPVSPRVVLVGISAENQVFNTLDMVGSGVQIHGSSYGPRSALVAALDLFAKGTVRAHVSEHPLESVNEIIEELRASDVLGRKVVVPRV